MELISCDKLVLAKLTKMQLLEFLYFWCHSYQPVNEESHLSLRGGASIAKISQEEVIQKHSH